MYHGDLIGNWGEIMFLVWIVPATWIVETKGPRMGALVSAAFILAGAAVRCLQWMFLNHSQSGLIFKILAHTGKKTEKMFLTS